MAGPVPLLRWGIENSDLEALHTAAADTGAQRKTFDPELVEFLLGKDDAQRIREETVVFLDDARPLDERLAAYESIEMLIEQIDNAVNVGRMGLWPGIVALAVSADAEPRLVRCALSLMGTAAQNNPEVQASLAALGVLRDAHAIVMNSSAPLDIRCKAMRAVSALVQHSPDNFATYSAAGSFSDLDALVSDASLPEALRDRAVFFASSLAPASDSVGDGEDASLDVTLDLAPYTSLTSLVALLRSA